DLVPLRVFIQLHVEPGELQLMVFGLKLVFGQVDDGVVFFNFDQHSLAVGRYLIGIDLAQDDFLAVFQAIGTNVRLPVGTALFRLANFVTAWSQRRLCILGQSDKVNALHIEINVLKLVLGKGRLEVTTGSEEQIFAVVAKSDVTRTVPFVGHRSLLFVGKGVNVNSR